MESLGPSSKRIPLISNMSLSKGRAFGTFFDTGTARAPGTYDRRTISGPFLNSASTLRGSPSTANIVIRR